MSNTVSVLFKMTTLAMAKTETLLQVALIWKEPSNNIKRP